MLGISVYLGKQSGNIQEKFIRDMSQSGFRSIFTSLHIPEDDATQHLALLKELGWQAKENGMELIADISPVTLENLNITYESLPDLLEWGITGLRMDYGVDPKVIARLSKTMKIALNASTIDDRLYQELKDCSMDFSMAEAWHNYYPRPETGLGKEDFTSRNKWLKEKGFTVMAFVPGDGVQRGPIFKGLPSLEKHRGADPFEAFLELKHECFADKVFIGDLTLKEETLNKFSIYEKNQIPLRCRIYSDTPETREILALDHINRTDSARDAVRSQNTRPYAAEKKLVIEPVSPAERKKGSITIDNRLYGRYQGELQITKRDLPEDSCINVIGEVVEEDLPLLRFVGGGQAFILLAKQ
ncbi:MupG family TIM beta-alpha barrel fold protein [Bacillus sp. MUM 13]|uniref:DUF871 domain-containing protein n=1 Tax=Bacillus sp. MUM 13 TaxID=1678001 RepID=UPI0008F5B326|nr:MupG family TIM beta-alpha barrel fold protein [Bacillus sp. MUM 13]OIK15345.1 hypothetical protein BIV59_00595 [Bacillus sp. MUM 13]